MFYNFKTLFLFTNKMLVVRATGKTKLDQTASSEAVIRLLLQKQSDLAGSALFL